MRRGVSIIAACGAVAGLLWFATPSAVGDFDPPLPELSNGAEDWIERRESAAHDRFGLVSGTEQRIRWQRPGESTDYVVIYLHGFSATRQETAPLAERIADALAANLFEARLSGHGRATEELADVTAESWIADAAAALTIGETLGERLVVLSTSTGGTLSLALLDHPLMGNVDTLAMISPNIELADDAAKWLTRPGGPFLARLMVGESRSWTAHNDAQERYWTTTYPTDSVIELVRLMDHAARKLPATIEQRVIMFVSPDDQVVSPDAAREAFAAIDAPAKRLVEVTSPGDPSSHVLAGDILSPDSTDDIARQIVAFVTESDATAPREP